ncbi:MAG: cell division protein CrgA [Actinomycetota bacterium]|nr:cell division protein CrgA [Actinomycetota bacterium]
MATPRGRQGTRGAPHRRVVGRASGPLPNRGRSGRPTPKGGTGRTAASNRRYTEPQARSGPSPKWVPVVMLVLVALGPIVIVANYLGVLPGSPTNWYLLVGIGLIGSGFFVATQYR